MSGDILVAKETFSTDIDGVPQSFTAGHTRVREGHPVLEGREHLFEPLGVHYDIEQATAAPGEKRSGRRSKKAAEKQPESTEGSTTTESKDSGSDTDGKKAAEKQPESTEGSGSQK